MIDRPALLEQALAQPAPGQIERLLDYEWIVLTRDGVPCIDVSRYDTRVVHLFTADDELARYLATHDLPSRLVRWADELSQLLPDGADLIPRERLRLTSGARFWRLRPEIRTRAWLAEARREAETIAAKARA